MLPPTLGNYRVDRLLGRGGMGSVYLAYDNTLRRPVALKVVESSVSADSSHDLLLREARNAAALNHPNICTIHEVRQIDGSAYIAMEYVDGQPLHERLRDGALPVPDVVRYGAQAASALAYAHDRGVVHRDLKAGNVIIANDRRLKIVDFGLARRSDPAADLESTIASVVPAGAPAGTPYAMAPEQVRGERADTRTDIWALGVLLYEMAAGTHPFRSATIPELFSSILRDEPAPLPKNVPAPLHAVIARCLEKDPARRYQRASDVQSALDAVHPGTLAPLSTLRYHVSRRPVVAAALASLIVMTALLLVGIPRSPDPATAAVDAPIRLAVLPFKNLTGDPEQEFFSDGLTDEMIGALGQLHPQALSVIARSSSMRYKSGDVPLDRIGRELGVNYVVEGSARREGNRVRVSAALIRISDQTRQWGDTYERELAGILAVQSAIAGGIAQALAFNLLPEERARLTATPPVNPEAYEAYLKGRSHANKLTRADLDRALEYFDTALQKDANYALAHVGVASVWSGRQQMGFVLPAEAAPHIKEALQRAAAIDDNVPELHLGLATTYTWSDWNWAAAEPEFKRALALNPNLAEAHGFYGHYLHIMRRPAEADAQMKQALALDPLDDLVQSLYARHLIFMRRYDEALNFANRVLSTTPKSPMGLNTRRDALFYLERYDEAFAAERALWLERGDRAVVDALDRGYAEGGFRAAMGRAGDAIASRSRLGGAALLGVNVFYRRAGRIDESFEWFDRVVEARDPNVPYAGVGPGWDVVRNDPRFLAFLRRLNLPQ